jgi:hypothetical protein
MEILSRIAPEFMLKQVAKMIPSLGPQSQATGAKSTGAKPTGAGFEP